MRTLHLTKGEDQAQGYLDFCMYALAANSYKGPELLKMMDLRDKLKAADHNKELTLEEPEWALLKHLANQTEWAGAAADFIGPFLKDLENTPTAQSSKQTDN